MRKLIIRKLGGVPKEEVEYDVIINQIWLKSLSEKIEALEVENKKLWNRAERLRLNMESIQAERRTKGV